MEKAFLPITAAAAYLGVAPQTLRRWHNSGTLRATLVSAGKHRYYSLTELELHRKGIVQIAKEWVKNVESTWPNKDYYCVSSDVFKARSERMLAEMKLVTKLHDTWSLIAAVIGEIGNNSYDHNIGNWSGVPGVFFAYDLGKHLVVLADRGRGVLRTLQNVRSSLKTEADALQVAFTEVVTGRAPENRGNGLKFVTQVTSKYHFPFTFQSGNAVLAINEATNSIDITLADTPIMGCLFIMKF